MVKRDLITNIIIVFVLFVGLICLRLYVFEPYRVQTTDANDYIANQDLVIAFKPAKLNYSDLVLYEVDGKQHIGRIIAKSGDSVTYMDDVLYLNNEVKEEPYLDRLKTEHHKQFIDGDYYTADFSIESLSQTVDGVIPKKKYLILNDHRDNSQDSRTYGLIGKEQIIGVISFRIAPIADFGFVDSI